MPRGVYVRELRSLEERFWRYILPEPNSGCWLWIGWTDHRGYGVMALGSRGAGRDRAHRVAYQLFRDEMVGDQHVLHRCDVRQCCNPSHLFLGQHADNMRDMKAKGRHAHGSRHGASRLTEAAVASIRQRVNDGEVRGYVADEYGISRSVVTGIMQRKRWAHV